MSDTEALIARLRELADKFSEGWHDGICIDAYDVMDLSKTAAALTTQATTIAALRSDNAALVGNIEELQQLADSWASLSQDQGKLEREVDVLRARLTSNPEVTIGRLKKRIAKLQHQRDGYHKQLAHYKVVVGNDWHIEHRYKKYQDWIDENKRVRALEARVKEQEELIKLLKKNQ